MAEQLTVNGVPIPDAAQRTPDRTITLPSGAVADLRKGKGRDLRRVLARRANAAEGAGAEIEMVFALIAELVRIDGRRVTPEDIDDMDLADVVELQTAVVGGNFQGARRGLSSPSSSADSPSQS